MDLTSAELAILESGTQRMGVFFRLATTPVLRVWLGVSKINPGINALDTTGEEYLGLGTLLDVPRFQQLLNGTAERVDVMMSGVSDQVLQIAQASPSSVKNKACAFGIALMNDSWQIVEQVRWIRRFVADYTSVRRKAATGPGESAVQAVALSVRSQTSNIRRPGLAYFSDQDQRARSPTDLFCERVHLYSQGTVRKWPTG